MTDLTKLTAEEFRGQKILTLEMWEEALRRLERLEKKEDENRKMNTTIANDAIEIFRLQNRLEQCEAVLRKARMLLIDEGDPDEDGEMIVEIDEFLGNAARAAVEEK